QFLVFGKFRMPVDAPVDRLLTNIKAHIKAHPDDPMGRYTLARLHYMAFALRSDKVGELSSDDLPTLGDAFHKGKPAAKRVGAAAISEARALQHLSAAVVEIEAAL